ncbi:hypothetical protein NM208_g11714 [Fusarium decemcellulare]|uniref:Uncharacterized protein n=1 Tax=Fusarium decemcellulare TaxID=57161 RepID=A0ACC1RRG0_9HYPO|nr:hypothetical protein NM208_g11714 [Fusarium decemcellulare]
MSEREGPVDQEIRRLDPAYFRPSSTDQKRAKKREAQRKYRSGIRLRPRATDQTQGHGKKESVPQSLDIYPTVAFGAQLADRDEGAAAATGWTTEPETEQRHEREAQTTCLVVGDFLLLPEGDVGDEALRKGHVCFKMEET